MKTKQPSEQTLAKNFPECDAKYIRQLLIDDDIVRNDSAVEEWCRQCYHLPNIEELRAFALNNALGMFGVEYIDGKRPFCYLNTGDSYGLTLIKYQDGNSWFISSWGDIVERGGY